MSSLDRSFTFSSAPRKFQTTHTDVQHTARLQRKQSRSSSRRPGDGYPSPTNEGYHPWHTAPNSHCNGGLKNAIDSVKDRLTQKLWVGTLGNSTDAFGPDLRDSVDSRMRELCGSVPVWIPDAEFESCYDEFCHQVRRFFFFSIKSAHPPVFRCSGPVCTMQFRMPQRRNSFTRAHPSSNTCPSTSGLQRSSSQTTAKATSVSAFLLFLSYLLIPSPSLGKRLSPHTPPRTPPCPPQARQRPYRFLPPRRFPLFRNLPVLVCSRVSTTWFPRS